jgi:hypothetical protein
MLTGDDNEYIAYESIDMTREYMKVNYDMTDVFIDSVINVHNGKENRIRFDPFFYAKINNVTIDNATMDDNITHNNKAHNESGHFTSEITKCNNYVSILKHIHDHGVMEGLIYHPRQIDNIIGEKIDLFKNIHNGNIYVKNNNEYIDASKYIHENIYSKTSEELFSDIKIIVDTIDTNDNVDLMFCIFIGDMSVGNILIELLTEYKQIHGCDFMVGVVLKNEKMVKKLKDIILESFKNVVIFLSKEYGNDITPSLQAYYYFQKRYAYKNIIKLHTKSDINAFRNCVEPLLNISCHEILKLANDSGYNCISNNKYYMSIFNDRHNKIILKKYIDKVNINAKFVATTNFFCKRIVFDAIIEFIHNNNPRSFFINNMYDTNEVNLDNSPIHFLERLFGIINV